MRNLGGLSILYTTNNGNLKMYRKDGASRLGIARMETVTKRYSLNESTIRRMIKRGDFPKPRKISGMRALGFLESELEAWEQSLEVADL